MVVIVLAVGAVAVQVIVLGVVLGISPNSPPGVGAVRAVHHVAEAVSKPRRLFCFQWTGFHRVAWIFDCG